MRVPLRCLIFMNIPLTAHGTEKTRHDCGVSFGATSPAPIKLRRLGKIKIALKWLLKELFNFNEHSEKARASHTNGPRDMPRRCGALSLLQKPQKNSN